MRPLRESDSRVLPENNHQILTVFFVVASLLGVFFTLGYIIGRNSPFMLGPSVASAHELEAKNVIEVPPIPPAQPAPAPPPAPAPVFKPVAAKPAPKPAPVAPLPPAAAAPAKDGPAGTFLQIVATNKEGIDAAVSELREKGFTAISVEIPEKRGWFRALVGPLADSAVPATRAQLKAAGFAGDAAIKRTF